MAVPFCLTCPSYCVGILFFLTVPITPSSYAGKSSSVLSQSPLPPVVFTSYFLLSRSSVGPNFSKEPRRFAPNLFPHPRVSAQCAPLTSIPRASLLLPSDLRQALPQCSIPWPLWGTSQVISLCCGGRHFFRSPWGPSWPPSCTHFDPFPSLFYQKENYCGFRVSQLSYSLYLGGFLQISTKLVHTSPSTVSRFFLLGEDSQFLQSHTPERTPEMSRWRCDAFLNIFLVMLLWTQGPRNASMCSTNARHIPQSICHFLTLNILSKPFTYDI